MLILFAENWWNLVSQPDKYTIKTLWTDELVAQKLDDIASRLIPKRMIPKRRRRWLPEEVPYIYTFPKANCFAASFEKLVRANDRQLTPRCCTKNHSCSREIVAKGATCPAWVASVCKDAARAVRTVCKTVGEHLGLSSFRLWRQCDVVKVVLERLDSLSSCIDATTCEACGAAKHWLSLIRGDANSFFPSVRADDVLAAFDHISQLYRDITGETTVTALRRRGRGGRKGGKQYDPRSDRRVFLLTELRDILQFDLEANICRLGELMVLVNYPAQGSSLSEVVCDMVALSHELTLESGRAERQAEGVIPDNFQGPFWT